MKDRCSNAKNNMFEHYGGRGITVCDRWNNSFSAFYEDMGDPPRKHSLDRIDNDGPYAPENCRWANKRQQANNTRANRRITFNGTTKTLTQWARYTGINRATIATRLDSGWPVSKALTEPADYRPERLITFDGKTRNLSQWAETMGISVAVLHQRLKQGWSVKDAIQTPIGGRWPSITFNGKTQNLSEWSRETGISRTAIRRRLKRGLSPEEALSKQ